MFWVMGLILGSTGSDDRSVLPIIIWVVAVFLSVLVHEMGHALAIAPWECGLGSRSMAWVG